MQRSPEINFATLPDCAMVRERQLLPIIPFGSATLWRRVKSGDFPQPVRLEKGRITAWRWGDVRATLEAYAQGGAA